MIDYTQLFPAYDITNTHTEDLINEDLGVTVLSPEKENHELLQVLQNKVKQERALFKKAGKTYTGVIQNFFYRSLPEEEAYRDSLWNDFVQHLNREINHCFVKLKKETLLKDEVFSVNDIYLQRYIKNSSPYGITPHRDQTGFLNLIAIYIVAGDSHFYICKDKTGKNKKEIPAQEGDIILMRGNYFNKKTIRPLHAVYGVQRERVTLTMRELSSNSEEREKITNTYKK